MALSITFQRSQHAIKEPIAKFGGQPCWINKAEWPISSRTNTPMRFICQLPLDHLSKKLKNKMAYLFLADQGCDETSENAWQDIEGESAVIIQPGKTICKTTTLDEGSTITTNLKASEYNVELTENNEIKPTLDDSYLSGHLQSCHVRKSLDGNKTGGFPIFWSIPYTHPFQKSWPHLLLQIDSLNVPFDFKLGKFGMGYIFYDDKSNIAKFYWLSSPRRFNFDMILNNKRDFLLIEVEQVQFFCEQYSDLSGEALIDAVSEKIRCWHTTVADIKISDDALIADADAKSAKCIQLMNERGLISIENPETNKQNMQYHCTACGRYIIPYVAGFQYCHTCTAVELIDKKMESWMARSHAELNKIIDCGDIFLGADHQIRKILSDQLGFRLYNLTPLNEFQKL